MNGGVGRAQPHVFLRVCRSDHLEMLWEKVGCWSAHFTGGGGRGEVKALVLSAWLSLQHFARNAAGRERRADTWRQRG